MKHEILNWQEGIAVYKRLLRYARQHWRIFIIAVLGNIAFAGADASFIALVKPLLDEGFVAQNQKVLAYAPFVVLGLFAIRGVAGFLANYYMGSVGRQVVTQMRRDLFNHLLYLPTSFHDQHSSGQLLSKIVFNSDQVGRASAEAITSIVKEGAHIILLVGIMAYHSWQVTLLFLIFGPLMAYVIRYASMRFRRISKKIQSTMGDITHTAEEALESYRVVKIFGGEAREEARFLDVSQQNLRQYMKMEFTKALSVPILQFIGAIMIALTLFLTTQRALQGFIMSAGTFVTLLGSMIALLSPLKKLTTVSNVIQQGIAAAQSIFEVLDMPIEQNTGQHAPKSVRGALDYQAVSFGYEVNRPRVLQEVSFSVQPGQTVALVGRSGSGKSTLVSLLPRFYEVSVGCIRVDGVDVRDYDRAALRHHMALVSQHVTLFNDTIFNNIAYGSTSAVSKEALERVAEAAFVMEFAEGLPDGLDTLVGENGVLLSGGQRQRIAIARALLKNAPILILDEATSSLDTTSERYIQRAIETLRKNRTTLVIAHRLSTIERADMILVMEAGQVVEAGTHETLLAKEGAYAALYTQQFQEVSEVGLDV